jgi:hypothetical protein
MSGSQGRLTLPDNPNLEQLREQAKERLDIIRATAPDAQLSDAQFALARDYGFASWRALKAEIDRRDGAENSLAGTYAYGETGVSNTIMSVTARGTKLFLEVSRGVTTEIIQQPNEVFETPGLPSRYRFERDHAGNARALIIETETGATVRAARISAERAAQMRSERDQAAKKDWRPRTSIELPEDVVERYVGHYASPIGEVIAFSREDRRLFMEAPHQRRVALDAESEVDFFKPEARLEFHFRMKDDVAASFILRVMGNITALSRISAEAAASLKSAVVGRTAEQAQPRQLAAVPPEILARYEGRYRIANSLEMAVDVKEGRIFAQVFGPAARPPRFEIFPESDTKFFWTAMPAQVSFFTNAEGKVAHGVWHQSGYLISMSRIEDDAAKVAPAA